MVKFLANNRERLLGLLDDSELQEKTQNFILNYYAASAVKKEEIKLPSGVDCPIDNIDEQLRELQAVKKIFNKNIDGGITVYRGSLITNQITMILSRFNRAVNSKQNIEKIYLSLAAIPSLIKKHLFIEKLSTLASIIVRNILLKNLKKEVLNKQLSSLADIIENISAWDANFNQQDFKLFIDDLTSIDDQTSCIALINDCISLRKLEIKITNKKLSIIGLPPSCKAESCWDQFIKKRKIAIGRRTAFVAECLDHESDDHTLYIACHFESLITQAFQGSASTKKKLDHYIATWNKYAPSLPFIQELSAFSYDLTKYYLSIINKKYNLPLVDQVIWMNEFITEFSFNIFTICQTQMIEKQLQLNEVEFIGFFMSQNLEKPILSICKNILNKQNVPLEDKTLTQNFKLFIGCYAKSLHKRRLISQLETFNLDATDPIIGQVVGRLSFKTTAFENYMIIINTVASAFYQHLTKNNGELSDAKLHQLAIVQALLSSEKITSSKLYSIVNSIAQNGGLPMRPIHACLDGEARLAYIWHLVQQASNKNHKIDIKELKSDTVTKFIKLQQSVDSFSWSPFINQSAKNLKWSITVKSIYHSTVTGNSHKQYRRASIDYTPDDPQIELKLSRDALLEAMQAIPVNDPKTELYRLALTNIELRLAPVTSLLAMSKS